MPSPLGHLRTFDERPNMSTEQRKAVERPQRGEVRMFGALRERQCAEQCVVLFIHVCTHETMTTMYEKQRVKRTQMPSLLGHLRTFDERPNMSTKQRKAAKAAAAG